MLILSIYCLVPGLVLLICGITLWSIEPSLDYNNLEFGKLLREKLLNLFTFFIWFIEMIDLDLDSSALLATFFNLEFILEFNETVVEFLGIFSKL